MSEPTEDEEKAARLAERLAGKVADRQRGDTRTTVDRDTEEPSDG